MNIAVTLNQVHLLMAVGAWVTIQSIWFAIFWRRVRREFLACRFAVLNLQSRVAQLEQAALLSQNELQQPLGEYQKNPIDHAIDEIDFNTTSFRKLRDRREYARRQARNG